MQYMGGKFHQGKHIAKAILDHTDRRGEYHEPFLGGANAFEHIAPHFSDIHASDAHPDLILLYQAIASGWDPPKAVSEAEYRALRNAPSSALRGFAGFGCSFGGKWFDGYARSAANQDYAGGTRNALLRAAPLLRRAKITCQPYTACSPRKSSVVYCDPPYRGTTKYKTEAFDHDRFWLIMQAWARYGIHVFVSEYEAPEGWRAIWEKGHTCAVVKSGPRPLTVEKLFVWGG